VTIGADRPGQPWAVATNAFRRLMRNGPAIVGMVFIAIFVIGAIPGPLYLAVQPHGRRAGE